MSLQSLVRSLAHRNYRLYFAGQGVSLVGTWMQQVAISWLVYQMTGSSFQLGMVMFCGQVPALFLSPVAGVLIDRWNRHRVLMLTQSLAMIQALLLASLTLSGMIQVWHLIVLSLCLGMINTFDMTTRQAFLAEMVTDRADLSNAIALNSSLVNGARLVGPTLAGFVLAQASAGVCFLLNGLSYIAVLLALAAMRLQPRPHLHQRMPLWEGLRTGFRYVAGFAPIRTLLLLLALTSLTGTSYVVLLPEFTVQRLHGDAHTLGMLTGASGLGALTGALFLASRKSVLGLGGWIAFAIALLGTALVSFTRVSDLRLALLVLFAIGFSMMVHMASSNTLLQTLVAEDKRGRVMSFYTMAFLGMAPLGSLLTGTLAARFGMSLTLLGNGLACLAAALFFTIRLPHLRALVRPIYVRLNILPEMTSSVGLASELKAATKE
jgi:MFS family permease